MTLKNLFTTHRKLDESETSPYTHALVDLLTDRFGVRPGERGAEIGSISGRLSSIFLDSNYPVAIVEPDLNRSQAFARLRTRWPQLSVLQGSANATGLADGSAAFILSERALYLPEREALRQEFARVLRPDGVVLLVTDNRVYGGGAQAEAFEQLLRMHCPNFREKAEPADIRSSVSSFFGDATPYEDAFISHQVLTLEAFLAQTSRLPIFPAAGDLNHASIFGALRQHFNQWAEDNRLRIPVVCRIACGHLGKVVEPHPESVAVMTRS